MSEIKHVNHYPEDWLVGTLGLSPGVKGTYRDVCDIIYSHGRAVTQAEIVHWTGSEHRGATQRNLKKLVELGKLMRSADGGYHNERCKKELAKTRQRIAGAKCQRPESQNGAPDEAAAAAKVTQTKRVRVTQDPTQDPTQTAPPKPLERPDSTAGLLATNHNKKKEGLASLATRARGPAPGFAAFWQRYPHKVGMPVAEQAYAAALSRASPAEIDAGLERYIANKPPDRQWCNPATFLNEDRWLDQPAVLPILSLIAGGQHGPTARHRRSPHQTLFAAAAEFAAEFEHADRLAG